MFPIRDENPTVRAPVATITIIGLNILVWLFVQGAGSVWPLINSFCLYSLIPGDLLGIVPAGTVIPMIEDVGCVVDGKGSVTTLITHDFLADQVGRREQRLLADDNQRRALEVVRQQHNRFVLRLDQG